MCVLVSICICFVCIRGFLKPKAKTKAKAVAKPKTKAKAGAKPKTDAKAHPPAVKQKKKQELSSKGQLLKKKMKVMHVVYIQFVFVC